MKIDVTKNQTVRYETLEAGDTFWYLDRLYMKLDERRPDDHHSAGNTMCVILASGLLDSLHGNRAVYPVATKVVDDERN